MANVLNNSMVMDMGNVFLLFNIYTFHVMILLTFLNGQMLNNNSNCWIFIIIMKAPHHCIRYTYLSKLVNKLLHGKTLDTYFSFLLNLIVQQSEWKACTFAATSINLIWDISKAYQRYQISTYFYWSDTILLKIIV